MSKDLHYEPPFYRELEHTGDLGIEVTAPTRGELFRRAALALTALLVEPSNVEATERRRVEISADDDINLMHDLLTELLQIFAADGFIWHDATVQEQDRTLLVTLSGESFDSARHAPNTEIKAVTYHQMAVEKVSDQWYARIIFDV